jgi:hypothetical protein
MSFLFLASAALAQPLYGEYRRLPAVELHRVEVKAAIEILSPFAGLRHEIAPGVQGHVTLSARGVMPEDALLAALGQADVAWVVRNGTLFVNPTPSDSSSHPEPRREEVTENLLEEPVPRLALEKVRVSDALAAFLRPHRVSFVVEPGIGGLVSLNLTGTTFETGLQRIAQEANATYRIMGGVFTIKRRGGPMLRCMG